MKSVWKLSIARTAGAFGFGGRVSASFTVAHAGISAELILVRTNRASVVNGGGSLVCAQQLSTRRI